MHLIHPKLKENCNFGVYTSKRAIFILEIELW
jgi:hypothetical protein